MDKYIIALLKYKGIGNVKVLNYILKYKKNIAEIKKHLNELIKQEDIHLFNTYVEDAEKEILLNKSNGINIISIMNDNYPSKLLMIKDPVLYLYYKGNISLINNHSIAIIGSRSINNNDELLTKDISKQIACQGITVISGLALGVDVNAHIGSYKEKGKTIAVLPSGINNIIPKTNKSVADSIVINGGLLVSEYSFNKVATNYTYVKRDRIQAALSDAVIVIKAEENSGTMNAVKNAQSSHKYVTQYIANNNRLILNSFNNTIEDINDIIKIAKKQDYTLLKELTYEQESLF